MNAADTLLGNIQERGVANKPALITETRQITYEQLENAACQFGHAMSELGVGAQDRVLMLVEDRPEFFFSYLGAMKIGAVPVALNLRISASELSLVIIDSGCSLIIVDPEFIDITTNSIPQSETAPKVILSTNINSQNSPYSSLTALSENKPTTLKSVQLGPDDMALWIYTSGTTGTPKGAIHLQKSIPYADAYLGPLYGVGSGDRIFCSSKLFFALTLGHCVLAALRLGASIILSAEWPSPGHIAHIVKTLKPTVMLSVPVMYKNLLEERFAEDASFKNIHLYLSAGEHLPRALSSRWKTATDRALTNGIGSTENLMLFMAVRPQETGKMTTKGSTGNPLPGTDVRLMDDHGALIEGVGIPGVMWIKSPTLAAGYWNRDEITAKLFQDGWYCSGDVFMLDANGEYLYQARNDDMLKISGQWVSPSEIEKFVLLCPRVFDAAVVGVKNKNGLFRLVLFLVAEDHTINKQELETEITETLKANLSVYKVPRRFYHLHDFPRTATGKVQRFHLRELAADQMVLTP